MVSSQPDDILLCVTCHPKGHSASFDEGTSGQSRFICDADRIFDLRNAEVLDVYDYTCPTGGPLY